MLHVLSTCSTRVRHTTDAMCAGTLAGLQTARHMMSEALQVSQRQAYGP